MFEKVKSFVSEKKNKIVAAVVGATAALAPAAAFASDGSTASTGYTFTADTFAPLTNMITNNLPVLLGVIVGILSLTIGVPWAIKFVKKFIH